MQGNHKPMITLDEYDKAQKILGKNGKPRFAKHEHAYTGEIKCTVIATGFSDDTNKKSSPSNASKVKRMGRGGGNRSEEDLEVPAFMRKTLK
jgi:hypothetical protein